MSKKQLLRLIQFAYRKAPQFDDVMTLLENVILFEADYLSAYIEYGIRQILAYLNFQTEIILSSDIQKRSTLRGTEKVLEICNILHATEYVNAIGGTSLYEKKDFDSNKIKLHFLRTGDVCYEQFNGFIPNLSIIDVLMFNPLSEVRKFSTNFCLL